MKLADYLTPGRVVSLETSSKAEALSELVAVLAESNGVSAAELSRAVMQREKMMSTGVGNGLAIPHVRMSGLKAASIAVGVSRNGIADYESLDDEPIRIIVLIAAPQGEHDTYIRLLARVAEALKKKQLRQAIVDTDDPAEVHRILTEGGM